MNIVPELNLNKHPNAIKNNSIVYADNIMLSKDATILQNDNTSIYKEDAFDCLDSEKYNETINIIYALPCSNEIIFFVRPNNNDSILDVVRYNEKENSSILVLNNFEYSGGKLLGTFTYNKGELIIAISEVIEEGNKFIPLRTFNLGSFENPITNINSDLHYLSPKVTIPTIKTYYTNGVAYKGWYYIFIRYKIDNYNYTQWFNTNESIFIDSYQQQTILNYFISKEANDNLTDNINVNNSILMSDDTNIAKVSFAINVVKNLDTRYIGFQLGFICTTNTDTKSFRTNDLNIYTKSIVFNIKDVVEYSANDLIKTYYNYYNVKTLDCINNRLYIGNYRENDKIINIDYSNITSILQENVEAVSAGVVTEKLYTENSIFIDAPDNSELTDRKIILKYARVYKSEKEVAILPYVNATNFIRQTSTADGRQRWFDCKETDEITIEITLGSRIGEKTILAEDFIYVPKIENITTINGIDYSGFYYNRGGFRKLDYEGDITLIKIGIESYGSNFINNGRIDKGTYTSEDIYNTIQQSVNFLNTIGIYPDAYYNFFIHFVDEFGEITNGIPISNIDLRDNNGEPIKLYKGLYKSPNATVNQKIQLLIDINPIPEPFIGYFISYEKFENLISYKSYCKIEGNVIKVYDDKLNYKDSIDFSFNKIKIFNITALNNNDENNLNKTYTKGNLYGDYEVVTKEIFPADSFNNVLEETHIEITISENLEGISEGIAYLYNDNIDSLYTSETKYLIPCTEIIYDTSTHLINTKNSFNSTNSALYYPNRIYFDDATKIYKSIDASNESIIEEKPIYIYSFNDHFEIPNESIQFNNRPLIIYFPNKGIKSTDEYERNFVAGSIVDIKNTIDLFKYNYKPIYENYPKFLTWLNPKINYIYNFPKTFRRSNVIQDESYTNNWRKFEIDQYRNINENKGDIIKLIGIGHYFIVHSQYSMFLFNGIDTIKSDEGSIQLSSVDILNLSYQEVITSKLGYGGIQDEHHGVIGTFGYIWYDKDENVFYNYDNKSIKLIDDNIKLYLRKLNITDVSFGDDKINNRLFIVLKSYNTIINILSYNYAINKFISFHNKDTFVPISYETNERNPLEDIAFISTKTKLIMSIKELGVKEDISTGRPIYYTINKLSQFTDDEYSNSSISIIHTTNYELMKYLDNIIYKVNKINNDVLVNAESPVEGKDIHYAADSLQIYSEHCDTGIINIDTSKNLNSPDNYMTPYWRFGNWHFNAIRNKVTDNDLVADEKSRIFGNWFVVKFNFNTDKKVEIESLECKTSIAEY